MKPQTLKTFIDVHTWVGLISGLALFIAFYAGAISVFTHEIAQWDDATAQHSAADSTQVSQALLEGVLVQHSRARESLFLQLPGEHGPKSVVYLSPEPGTGSQWREFRWSKGAVDDAPNPSQLANFVVRLHYTAGLPEGWGIYVLGIGSILYGIALATGVVIYAPGFVRDLFALRVGPNLKRLWQDAHNAIGVLSLPFHAMFAWSGALLCLGTLFLVPFQSLTFENKLMDIIGPDMDVITAAPNAGVASPTLSVDELIAHAQRALPALRVESLSYTQIGDAHSQVTAYGPTDGKTLVPLAGVALDGNTGEVLRVVEPSSFSAGMTFYWGLFTLHYAQFGGALLKWFYFLLAMAGAFLFYSGNLLWIEAQRNRRSSAQSRSSKKIAQLTIGVCIGCIVGISAAFVSSRVLPETLHERARWMEASYYSAFFLSLLWSFIRSPARGARELLMAAAILSSLVPAASAVKDGTIPFIGGLTGNWTSSAIDLTSIALGFLFWRIAHASRRRAMTGDPNSVWADARL